MRINKSKYVYHLLLLVLLISIVSPILPAEAKGNKKADINKAIPLFLRKEYKKAKKILVAILKEDPNNVVARYYLAEVLFTDVRRYNDAKKQFEIVLRLKNKIKSSKFKIRNKYIFNNSLLKLGLVYLKNGQNNKAIDYMQQFLKNDSESKIRIVAFNSIAVAYSNLDDYENAIYYFEEAINLDKENLLARFNLSSVNSKLIYFKTGLDMSIKGKHIDASREFVKALEVDPFFVAAHFRLGLEHKALKNYVDAENELLRAYAINPQYVLNYRIKSELAEIYLNLDEIEKSKRLAEESMELNSNFPHVYNVLGMINMKDGDYHNAVTNFSKAIDIKVIPEYMENLKKAQDALVGK
ncbi:tetratricopeptide repeat protein [Thermodesulfobacteriota bacterium]